MFLNHYVQIISIFKKGHKENLLFLFFLFCSKSIFFFKIPLILLNHVVCWQIRIFITVLLQYFAFSTKFWGELFLRLPLLSSTVHVSGFGRSKAKTHLNIRTHYF